MEKSVVETRHYLVAVVVEAEGDPRLLPEGQLGVGGEAEPRVVDQHVDAAVLLPQVVPQPGDGGLVRDVQRVVAGVQPLPGSVSKSSIRRFVITEKAPTIIIRDGRL